MNQLKENKEIEELKEEMVFVIDDIWKYKGVWTYDEMTEKLILPVILSLKKKWEEEAVRGFGEWLEDNHTEYGYKAMFDLCTEYLTTKGDR